jgi:hypothetical protein
VAIIFRTVQIDFQRLHLCGLLTLFLHLRRPQPPFRLLYWRWGSWPKFVLWGLWRLVVEVALNFCGATFILRR